MCGVAMVGDVISAEVKVVIVVVIAMVIIAAAAVAATVAVVVVVVKLLQAPNGIRDALSHRQPQST